MVNYVLAHDGFYHEITKANAIGSACMECKNGRYYTVKLKRYIPSNKGFLYPILEKNKSSGVTITGIDDNTYHVENHPLRIKRSNADLSKFKCTPIPPVILKGEGKVNCNRQTSICEINAPKGTKVSIGTKKGFTKRIKGNKVWLEPKR